MEMVNPHNAATSPKTHPPLSMDRLRETAMDIRRGQDGIKKIHRIAPVDSGWIVLAEYTDDGSSIYMVSGYHHDLSLHRHLRGSATLATGLTDWADQTTGKIPPPDTPTASAPRAPRAKIDRLRETAMDITRSQPAIRKIHRIAPRKSGWIVLAEYNDTAPADCMISEYRDNLSLLRHITGSATLATGLTNWIAQTTSKIPPTDTPTPSATRATIDRAERQCGIQREKYLAAARAWATSSEQTELVRIEMEIATEITDLISRKLKFGF